MDPVDQRAATVRSRCTKPASEYLEMIRSDALYPKVIDRLQAVPGRIFEADIEKAFYQVKISQQRNSF